MKRLAFILTLALACAVTAGAAVVTVKVSSKQYQRITGFGAADCDGAMCPFGTDTKPVQLLYGPNSVPGFNIMRMEISPNFVGDVNQGWDTPYDWQGSVPSARLVKQRGGIVFGTPWSPPGAYKTNGTPQGGNSDSQGNKRGTLRDDCYSKFFPWFNTFLKYMKSKGVTVDAVSLQNEPDWWVNYSGCLYTPQQLHTLVKSYASLLDRETYNGVRLISGESLGFGPEYSDILLKDPETRQHIDIIGGHLYGHPPLGNMKKAAVLASKYGKEVWMTEHSVENIGNHDGLPNWHEQLLFAEELNECMLAGGTGYIYWYMRAHWAFVGTGEAKHMPGNGKNVLLPRAYVASHFSKHLPGATRLGADTYMGFSTAPAAVATNTAFETSAYIKGDSLVVIAIDTTKNAVDMKLQLPYRVKSGKHILSTGNDIKTELCRESAVELTEPTQELTIQLPARSLSTFIFQIDRTPTGIEEVQPSAAPSQPSVYYDLRGRRLAAPKGLCIERQADGTSRKVFADR
jgi:glucuronoarabinoxylan endo-1,4-beta-xylanase